jgi:hypothetical protein
MFRLFSGIVSTAFGLLLFLFRMPLVYQLVGKTKTKIALSLGINKLQIFLAILWIVAALLIIGGIALVAAGLRGKKSRTIMPLEVEK